MPWDACYINYYIQVQDANITKCGPDKKKSAVFAEKALWSLTDVDLCPENIVLYVTIAVLVPDAREGVALLPRVTWVKEKDIDKDKEFDAFISFSHKDQDLVIPELIDRIRSEAVYPLQALSAGRTHPTQHHAGHSGFQEDCPRAFQVRILIPKHTLRMRCMMIHKPFFSRSSFLESEWCMFEFRVAHIEGLKNHLNRIIIIKMDDLPKDADLPEEIQVYLKSTRYLKWGTSTSGTPYSTPFPDLSTLPNHLIQNKSLKFPTFIVNLIPLLEEGNSCYLHHSHFYFKKHFPYR
ncbi:protein toll [Caerostris extrusa]|uniref:Protein toll n=1 Tax=Caerostris extrusa TaxID=172846 RepID=A0AAV4S279_CAEEX|nr:protein toll [Caerostris extrusa]